MLEFLAAEHTPQKLPHLLVLFKLFDDEVPHLQHLNNQISILSVDLNAQN